MKEERPGAGQVLAAAGKTLAFLALFLGSQMAVSYVYLYYVLGELGPGALSDPDLYQILLDRVMSASVGLTLVSGLMTLAIVAVVYFAIRRMAPGEALWLRPVKGAALWSGAALAPALYALVTLIMMVLPQGLVEDYAEASASLEDASALAFLCVVVVSPVVEEVVFRGLIMTRLTRVLPPWPAVVLSACIFGLCHGEFLWFCYAFALGLVFGLLDMRTRSILPSILAHMAFNLIGQTFTTLSSLFPEGRWVMPALLALLVLGLLLAFLFRREAAAIFRMDPVEEERTPAPGAAAPGPVLYYEGPAAEGGFSGEETYSYRDDVTAQDPWEG